MGLLLSGAQDHHGQKVSSINRDGLCPLLSNDLIRRLDAATAIALGYPRNLNSSSEQRAMDSYDQVSNAIKAPTPLGRTGEPEDIGLIVAFLASDEARWLTGEIIFGSGGLR